VSNIIRDNIICHSTNRSSLFIISFWNVQRHRIIEVRKWIGLQVVQVRCERDNKKCKKDAKDIQTVQVIGERTHRNKEILGHEDMIT